jgi:hypothetical protein
MPTLPGALDERGDHDDGRDPDEDPEHGEQRAQRLRAIERSAIRTAPRSTRSR